MQIIIDGYNVIGSDSGLTGNLEHRRNLLVQRLAGYHRNKGHDITVVFDGWRSGSIDEVQQKRDGICIVYSRLGEKADSVVVSLARRQGAGCVVVTSDREVRSAVERFGAVALYAGEFGEMLRTPGEPFDDQEPDYSQQRTPKKRESKTIVEERKKAAREAQQTQILTNGACIDGRPNHFSLVGWGSVPGCGSVLGLGSTRTRSPLWKTTVEPSA